MSAATGAEAEIRDGMLVISIDVDALPVIVWGSCATGSLAGLWKVTDPAVFAKEVCRSLNDEREDGTTRVHLMFDGAFAHAIDQGAEGIEPVGEGEFEDQCSRLQRSLAVPGNEASTTEEALERDREIDAEIYGLTR